MPVSAVRLINNTNLLKLYYVKVFLYQCAYCQLIKYALCIIYTCTCAVNSVLIHVHIHVYKALQSRWRCYSNILHLIKQTACTGVIYLAGMDTMKQWQIPHPHPHTHTLIHRVQFAICHASNQCCYNNNNVMRITRMLIKLYIQAVFPPPGCIGSPFHSFDAGFKTFKNLLTLV